MVTRPPPNRRKFRAPWDEIDYLYFKAGYWMYERERRGRATPYVARLKTILNQSGIVEESIPIVEARGLIADFDQNKQKEIHYKELEISLLHRLLKAGSPVQGYSWSTVLSEMSLLATLLEEGGRRAEALKKIEECIRFARKHRLKFHDGEARKLIWRASR